MNKYTLNTYKTTSGQGALVAIGVIAIIIALLITWFIASQPEEDLTLEVATTTDGLTATSRENIRNIENEIQTGTSTIATGTDIETARLDARSELLLTEAKLEAGQNYQTVLAEVESIEADLARAYATTSAELQAEWQEIKTEFDAFEASLRAGTADALEVVAGLILLLESDVRIDEE